MDLFRYTLCLWLMTKITWVSPTSDQYYYKEGGYTARWCFGHEYTNNITVTYDDRRLKCSQTKEMCAGGRVYLCEIPCGFYYKKIYINGRTLKIEDIPLPQFHLERRGPYHPGDMINITTRTSPIRLEPRNLRVSFYGGLNGSCSNISVSNTSITCLANFGNVPFLNPFNSTLIMSLESESCNRTIHKVEIQFVPTKKSIHWIIGVFTTGIIVSSLLFIFVLVIRRYRSSMKTMATSHSEEVINDKRKIVNFQKRAFLEYQTAVDSFTDLGSLTSRHIVGFYNFISRVFNVELPMKLANETSLKNTEFKELILDKNKLMSWISGVEKNCKSQQRSLIASLLTIVLFQHPEYLLEIMKCLLVKYIKDMKESNEERILFRRSEAIIEKIVGNWITMCLYKNLKTGEVGKRFFNLYRAIKCKMNQGLLDCVTNKAKYALTFDSIMLCDIDYEVLNIKANVQVNLNMMNTSSGPLVIHLDGIDIQVLSLDSVSQVKEKILDRALMVYSNKEDVNDSNPNSDLCVGICDVNDFKLQLINKTCKITLKDIDNTSVISTLDKEYVRINTMKHYNMCSGMTFLLSSLDIGEIVSNEKIFHGLAQVHLQFPQDINISQTELQKQRSNSAKNKSLFNPVIEDMDKEVCLMRILGTKQSLLTFIDGFFQCIFNWNPKQVYGVSSDSLFEREDCQSSFRSMEQRYSGNKEAYLAPIYYLFSMFDDIAALFNITDAATISLWKSNSFILRFWINLIKNPNFIFSVDRGSPIDGSLTTIATILMESCSLSSSNTLADENLPIVKQLFIKELKEYSSWWRCFTESGTKIEESTVVTMMKDVSDTFNMDNQYESSLASLSAIANSVNTGL